MRKGAILFFVSFFTLVPVFMLGCGGANNGSRTGNGKTLSDYERAHRLYEQESYAEALVLLDKVTDNDPQDWKAWGLKGNCLGYQGNSAEAIACYDKAISLNPDDPASYMNKGIQMEKQANYTEALALFDKVIELRPDDREAMAGKAFCLEMLGRAEEAAEWSEKAGI